MQSQQTKRRKSARKSKIKSNQSILYFSDRKYCYQFINKIKTEKHGVLSTQRLQMAINQLARRVLGKIHRCPKPPIP